MQILVSLLILLSLVSSINLIKPSNKICNPNPQSLIPFTGFKILRQYKVSGYKNPLSMHFITIAHCNHGQIDYQKVIRTKSSSEVDWSVPFCLLKPKLGEKLITLNSLNVDEDSNTNELNFEVLNYLNNKSLKLKKLIRKKLDLILEKVTNGKWVEYSGKSKSETFQNFKTSSNNLQNETYQNQNFNLIQLKNSFINLENSNLVCYKLSRRKKYAKRKISFFMPHTFVGGIFECLISSEMKQLLFKNFLNEFQNNQINSIFLIQNSTHQNFFKCDSNLSRPIAPLIAEDSTNQWFINKILNVLNPHVIQNIPYLTTTTPLNLRFSMFETSDMYKDSWANKIEINEDYIYDEADLHFLTKAINYSSDLLNKLISPIDFNFFWEKFNKGNENENENESKKGELSFDQKLFLVLGRIGKIRYVNDLLLKVEKQWEKIKD
ncbi:hypothetical protein KGF54_002660 [Candida jiufengensis]|uniref:uncharacterized protein n=1 Tax=Candida jiufengensis TaxID=497108 RepID=UPI002224D25E|nr:uncharacterized protein KGF54_002660 [Candida jiufengensis]KAI5953289.1 hypothetical protein KGF54_002660 [Candida jiufengensis]